MSARDIAPVTEFVTLAVAAAAILYNPIPAATLLIEPKNPLLWPLALAFSPANAPSKLLALLNVELNPLSLACSIAVTLFSCAI